MYIFYTGKNSYCKSEQLSKRKKEQNEKVLLQTCTNTVRTNVD